MESVPHINKAVGLEFEFWTQYQFTIGPIISQRLIEYMMNAMRARNYLQVPSGPSLPLRAPVIIYILD